MTRAPTPERSTDPRLTTQLEGLGSLWVQVITGQDHSGSNRSVISDVNAYKCVEF